MSVSDPLIKDIKGYVSKFLNDFTQTGCITDKNPNLLPFCQALEKVFSSGIIPSQNVLGFTKSCDAWSCLEKIEHTKDSIITFQYSNAVETVKKYRNILTNTGKLRLLIRCCLINKSLHIPLKYLVKYKNQNVFYKRSSILGDEILLEIFLSVLLQCSKIHFKLDGENVSFLDFSWILPEYEKLVVVPCKNLGITVSFANNKAIIVDIKENSVLQDYHTISIGDVLDNLNKIHICSATKGKLNSILGISKGQPITLTVIKAKYSDTNELYKPIVDLLKQVDIDFNILKDNCSLPFKSNLQLAMKGSNSAGFLVTYVGFVNIGKTGDVKQIDKSIKTLDSNSASGYSDCKRIKKAVRFEVGELGVKIVDNESSTIILKHSYMEISSCGSLLQMPNHFAYIAGNDNCNNASSFTSYIFYSKDWDLASTILQSIGQGFHRTHFAV